MRFTLGDKHFTVVIAARPLMLDGQPRLAKLDRARGYIWISDQLPRHDRRQELFHELRHVWVDRHGRPVDDEADAVNAAQMMDWLHDQYLQQGGDAVLETLDPLPDVPLNKQASGRLMQAEVQCGSCRASIAMGSVANSSPAWSADLGAWTIARVAWCESCERATSWGEMCTAEGMPVGVILPHPPPRVLVGNEAKEWMQSNPKVCRCLMLTA